jgi:hypothetical protein
VFCGFRRWALIGHELASSNAGLYSWTIGTNEALCLRARFLAVRAWAVGSKGGPSPGRVAPNRDHRVPEHACDCGLYAQHDPWKGMDRFLCDGPPVYGAVAVWGRLEVHAEGVRAQYARVLALAPGDERELAEYDQRPAEFAARLRALAEEFGVVCCRREELPDVAAEHGTPVPEELRPAPPARPTLSGTLVTPTATLTLPAGSTIVRDPLRPAASLPGPAMTPQARRYVEERLVGELRAHHLTMRRRYRLGAALWSLAAALTVLSAALGSSFWLMLPLWALYTTLALLDSRRADRHSRALGEL